MLCTESFIRAQKFFNHGHEGPVSVGVLDDKQVQGIHACTTHMHQFEASLTLPSYYTQCEAE